VEELRVREMTAAEFAAFREQAIRGYAEEHVRAGNWSPSEAQRLAAEETDELLPQGVDTPGTLLLVGETGDGEVVGVAWVELQHRRTTGAWIYDIEIKPEQRGRGLGRALLRAVESAVEARGVGSIALHVFGQNTVAQQLYRSSGYEVTSMSMRKPLGQDHPVQ
jgi:ribosomal protein S18 acetylase RimI-like enzyme